MADPEAPFDAARFSLHFDAAVGLHLVQEMYTESKVYLDPGYWELHRNEACEPYVAHSAGDSRWCVDLFDVLVVQHPCRPEVIIVQDCSGERYTLAEFKQRHRSIEVPIQVLGHSVPVHIDCFVLFAPASGAQTLWSLAALYSVFAGSEGASCSRWYQNWWQRWQKLLSHLGDDATMHMRKPTATRHSAEGLADATRFLPVAIVSAHALIPLLTRWSNESKTKLSKNRSQQQSWRLCLDALITTFMSDIKPVDVAFFLDAIVDMRPGLPLVGNNMVLMRIVGGTIVLTPLATCDEAVALAAMSVLGFPDPPAVPLAELCLGLDRAGRKVLWLWKQVVFNMACIVEGQVLEMATPGANENQSGPPPAEPELLLAGAVARGQAGRKRKHDLAMRIVPLRIDDRSRKLINYFFCMRHHFAKQNTVHLAVDASRVGMLNRMLGLISRPGGEAAWLPPQACLVALGYPTCRLHKGIWKHRLHEKPPVFSVLRPDTQRNFSGFSTTQRISFTPSVPTQTGLKNPLCNPLFPRIPS